MTTADAWPLVYIGRRPRGRKGQRCKRLRRSDLHPDKTLVLFKRDGAEHWVLDRMLVKAEEY